MSSAPKQISSMVKSFNKSERQIFVEETGMGTIEISEAEMISLKANLEMPWEKLKKMGRLHFL